MYAARTIENISRIERKIQKELSSNIVSTQKTVQVPKSKQEMDERLQDRYDINVGYYVNNILTPLNVLRKYFEKSPISSDDETRSPVSSNHCGNLVIYLKIFDSLCSAALSDNEKTLNNKHIVVDTRRKHEVRQWTRFAFKAFLDHSIVRTLHSGSNVLDISVEDFLDFDKVEFDFSQSISKINGFSLEVESTINPPQHSDLRQNMIPKKKRKTDVQTERSDHKSPSVEKKTYLPTEKEWMFVLCRFMWFLMSIPGKNVPTRYRVYGWKDSENDGFVSKKSGDRTTGFISKRNPSDRSILKKPTIGDVLNRTPLKRTTVQNDDFHDLLIRSAEVKAEISEEYLKWLSSSAKTEGEDDDDFISYQASWWYIHMMLCADLCNVSEKHKAEHMKVNSIRDLQQVTTKIYNVLTRNKLYKTIPINICTSRKEIPRETKNYAFFSDMKNVNNILMFHKMLRVWGSLISKSNTSLPDNRKDINNLDLAYHPSSVTVGLFWSESIIFSTVSEDDEGDLSSPETRRYNRKVPGGSVSDKRKKNVPQSSTSPADKRFRNNNERSKKVPQQQRHKSKTANRITVNRLNNSSQQLSDMNKKTAAVEGEKALLIAMFDDYVRRDRFIDTDDIMMDMPDPTLCGFDILRQYPEMFIRLFDKVYDIFIRENIYFPPGFFLCRTSATFSNSPHQALINTLMETEDGRMIMETAEELELTSGEDNEGNSISLSSSPPSSLLSPENDVLSVWHRVSMKSVPDPISTDQQQINTNVKKTQESTFLICLFGCKRPLLYRCPQSGRPIGFTFEDGFDTSTISTEWGRVSRNIFRNANGSALYKFIKSFDMRLINDEQRTLIEMLALILYVMDETLNIPTIRVYGVENPANDVDITNTTVNLSSNGKPSSENSSERAQNDLRFHIDRYIEQQEKAVLEHSSSKKSKNSAVGRQTPIILPPEKEPLFMLLGWKGGIKFGTMMQEVLHYILQNPTKINISYIKRWIKWWSDSGETDQKLFQRWESTEYQKHYTKHVFVHENISFLPLVSILVDNNLKTGVLDQKLGDTACDDFLNEIFKAVTRHTDIDLKALSDPSDVELLVTRAKLGIDVRFFTSGVVDAGIGRGVSKELFHLIQVAIHKRKYFYHPILAKRKSPNNNSTPTVPLSTQLNWWYSLGVLINVCNLYGYPFQLGFPKCFYEIMISGPHRYKPTLHDLAEIDFELAERLAKLYQFPENCSGKSDKADIRDVDIYMDVPYKLDGFTQITNRETLDAFIDKEVSQRIIYDGGWGFQNLLMLHKGWKISSYDKLPTGYDLWKEFSIYEKITSVNIFQKLITPFHEITIDNAMSVQSKLADPKYHPLSCMKTVAIKGIWKNPRYISEQLLQSYVSGDIEDNKEDDCSSSSSDGTDEEGENNEHKYYKTDDRVKFFCSLLNTHVCTYSRFAQWLYDKRDTEWIGRFLRFCTATDYSIDGNIHVRVIMDEKSKDKLPTTSVCGQEVHLYASNEDFITAFNSQRNIEIQRKFEQKLEDALMVTSFGVR